jgi:REP element-mobilizing transposase RayT
MSRTVAGQRLWDAAAKEVLRKMIWEVADFCGVEVLAYCVMSNHFHVLVRVSPEQAQVDQAELLRRYRRLYDGRSIPGFPSGDEMEKLFSVKGEEVRRWEERLRSRMGDVSSYLKTLKQRFTGWFNKSHDRFGTLWAERFRSVLVEDSDFARQTVAAYIDLNPVRAGLTKDPAEYRWCSHAEVMAGFKPAQQALEKVMGADRCPEPGQSFLEAYRMVLVGRGRGHTESGGTVIPEEIVERIRRTKGSIGHLELLRCRVRYFSAGVILGSESFVRSMGERLRSPAARRLRPKLLGRLPMADEVGQTEGSGKALVSWRQLTNAIRVPERALESADRS